MPDPVDPSRTAATPHDQAPSAASDTDETAAATSRAGTGPAPLFGPPAGAGEVGTLGPYRVLKELGKGGMGAVYLALDTRLDRKLAFKVMLPEFAADKSAKERFLREARAAAKISHDNVVTVFEADERDGVPYIAMQYLQGSPLDAYLKTKGTPALPHVLRIARETALGLAAAHALGLVHRDIKPANLWLEAPNGRVKVLDFGLARAVDAEAELTKSGAVVGTPAYMSPEQGRGLKVDHRTDLFSLGGVLYRLCTGKTPFSGPNVMAVLMALGNDDPTPVRELNPNVPEALAALIHQLLAKKPEDRPQTATEVAKRLRAILEQTIASPAAAAMPAVIPTASAADISHSMPVVVNPVPVQPPVVSQMHVSAQPESAFDNLDAPGVTEVERAPAEPKPARKGGKGLLIAAGVAVLLAGVAVAVVVSQMGKKKEKEPEAKTPEGGTPVPKVGPGPVKPSGPLPAAYKNSFGMEFVRVPKGTGWLGGGGGKEGETKVVFDQDFYLGKYEVTQAEWEAVMGTNPSYYSRTGEGKDAVKDITDADLKRFPVETVSWDDCQLFLARLNEKAKETGWVYRLPKEAEWEYACRGGPVDKPTSSFSYYFAMPTHSLLPVQANFEIGGPKRTCKVGSYEPNSLGLHDMHGNVWECCEDAAVGADGDPHRVVRSGDWSRGDGACRADYRSTISASVRHGTLGLRVGRVPVGPLAPTAKADADRAAAEWALALGGKVTVKDVAGEKPIGAAKDLPAVPFLVSFLDLTRTQVTDADLVRLKGLTGITRLSLNHTGVSDMGLEYIKPLTGLTHLWVAEAKITDAGLANLKGMTHLSVLHVHANAITDAGLEHLSGLSALNQLHIVPSKATAAGVTRLAMRLPKCQIIWDGGTIEPTVKAGDRAAAEWALSIGGTVTVKDAAGEKGVTAAKELPAGPFTLGFIDLTQAGAKVTDDDLARLKGLSGLSGLSLNRTGVTDAGLGHLGTLTGLKSLYLDFTKVTDDGLTRLTGLKALESLWINATNVTDTGLEHLKGLDRLTFLDLRITKVTAAGVAKLAKALQKCKIEWDGGVIEPAKK